MCSSFWCILKTLQHLIRQQSWRPIYFLSIALRGNLTRSRYVNWSYSAINVLKQSRHWSVTGTPLSKGARLFLWNTISVGLTVQGLSGFIKFWWMYNFIIVTFSCTPGKIFTRFIFWIIDERSSNYMFPTPRKQKNKMLPFCSLAWGQFPFIPMQITMVWISKYNSLRFIVLPVLQ